MSIPAVAPLNVNNCDPLPQNVVGVGVTVPAATVEHAEPETVNSAAVDVVVPAQFVTKHRYPQPVQLAGTLDKLSVFDVAVELVVKPL